MRDREKEAFARRLLEAMRELPVAAKPGTKHGVNASALQKVAGVTREMARRYVEGMAIPNPDTMRLIADWLEVRVAWLRDGEEPKRPVTGRRPISEIDAMMSAASPRSQRVIRRIKEAAEAGRLTDEDMEVLGAMAERLENKKP